MIRLFKVYYPLRTLVLLVGEALIVWTSFLLATIWRNQDSWLLLNVDGGYLQVLAVLGPKILTITGVVLLLLALLLMGAQVADGLLYEAFFKHVY